MKNNQLEMTLKSNQCRSLRRSRRAFRAKWWFTQMRAAVDSAPEQKPFEEPAEVRRAA
jgi:hypothetical protein